MANEHPESFEGSNEMARAGERGATQVTTDIKTFRQRVSTGLKGTHHVYVTLLGLQPSDTGQLIRQVEKGLPFRVVERLRRNMALTSEEFAELIQVRPRTLSRRKEEGRLQPDESDRALRASRLFGGALELFEGDVAAARTWLSSAQPALGGAVPLSVAKTELGAREVEQLIGRLEHGVFS
jgi:putative toxin-antitoxin system antitoxin component (TIGR02293 family)